MDLFCKYDNHPAPTPFYTRESDDLQFRPSGRNVQFPARAIMVDF